MKGRAARVCRFVECGRRRRVVEMHDVFGMEEDLRICECRGFVGLDMGFTAALREVNGGRLRREFDGGGSDFDGEMRV